MNWLYYLTEVNIYISVFYLFYCLFLMRETHYVLNRMYLLFSCLVSFIIPLVQIGLLNPVETLTQNVVQVQAIDSQFTLQDGILGCYFIGVAILMVLLIIKLYNLQKLAKANQTIAHGSYKLIYLEGENTAFSFFNYLFIGTQVPEVSTITRHELVHINQKHSIDILFLEIFKVISWFNPVVYLLQNSLKTVHEYIADEKTAETDVLTYSTFLVNNAYGISGTAITHSFFNYNLLKKRIIMLNQQRSGNLARLKYLVAVPICAGLLCTSTLAFSKTYVWVDVAPNHLKKTIDTIKKKLPPPPPPAPPVAVKKSKKSITLPPPPPPEQPVPVKNSKKRLPPPPPPAPPVAVKDAQVLPPPPPAPPKQKVRVVKFPPPVVKPDGKQTHKKPMVDQVKFPPPIIKRDKKPKHQKLKVDQVKFPPPVVKPDNE